MSKIEVIERLRTVEIVPGPDYPGSVAEIRAIRLLPTSRANVGAAAELAMVLGYPITDSRYLGLAIEQDCDLATCDAEFAAKAGAVYAKIKRLADYGD